MISRTLVACIASCILVVATSIARADEHEAVMDEVVVEGAFEFDFRLELPKQSAVQTLQDRLAAREEAQRALDLQTANQSAVTKILDLTRYSPIPLFSTQSRVDTFFQENYMRADLNPRGASPLFETEKRRDR